MKYIVTKELNCFYEIEIEAESEEEAVRKSYETVSGVTILEVDADGGDKVFSVTDEHGNVTYYN